MMLRNVANSASLGPSSYRVERCQKNQALPEWTAAGALTVPR